jgi:hypothetical protein|tara:strand:+ start:3894 stop:4559 length:666 start_codon:yes stop_codon:yes gene_type:complete
MKSKKIKNSSQASEYFQNNNYIVLTEALSKEVASLLFMYLKNKKETWKYLLKKKLVSPFEHIHGTFNDPKVPNTFSIYGDVLMDTMMIRLQPHLESITGLTLVPTYTYTRLYKYGDILRRHKDRDSCEISFTLNLGGDSWPIFLEPTGEKGKKGVSINLNAGDLLVYRGVHLEHWREMFEGNECGQVFCHYNDLNGPFQNSNLFDKRPMIGLPNYTIGKDD